LERRLRALARNASGWHDQGSEVLVLKTLRSLALVASFGMLVVIGCGDDSKDGGANLPPRNSGEKDGGQTNTSSSGTTSSSGEPTYDCTNHEPVSDTPSCDTCAKAKCCKQITICDSSESCKAVQSCVKACPDDDLVCVFGCDATGGSGSDMFREVGACASNNCKAECPQPEVDGGFDAF
jgi:hypothetical protein